MYLYLKALHIIFIVTWFAGLFYMPRLFIYSTEAQDKAASEKTILTAQFAVMMRRLWLGITWPSAIITAIAGPLVWAQLNSTPRWLAVKLVFVGLLYLYHFSLHKIYRQQQAGVFRYNSQQLRMWNEVATIFLVAIVFLATVKSSISALWGIVGLVALIALLLAGIKIYKYIRIGKGRV